MANTVKYGFRPIEDEDYHAPRKWPAAASQTIAVGDVVYIDSNGRIALATSTTPAVCGVAASPVTNSSAGDDIFVWDHPNQKFEAMVSTGALADPYTHTTLGNCYDLTGSSGAQYVNAASSTYDIFKCVGVSKDPVTGLDSEVGANQMKIWVINPNKHQLGDYSVA